MVEKFRSWLVVANLPFYALLIVIVPACEPLNREIDDHDLIVEGVNFTHLFAPPADAEIEAVLGEWSNRAHPVAGYVVEVDRHVASGDRILIISHLVDGFRHYGAVRLPADAAEVRHPVLVLLHGGDGGTSLQEMDLFSLFLNDPSVSSRFIYVLPSFRSEPLRANTYGGTSFSGTYRSDGAPSPWDRDVDDAMSLLSAVLLNLPQADGSRVAVVGFSRGAGVGLLMGVRDPRAKGVAAFFGPTNFFLPAVQEIAETLLKGESVQLPGVDYLRREVLAPLQRGDISMAQARRELVRRSAAYFTHRLPALQIHHGGADAIVPVEHGDDLDARMTASGVAPHVYYRYPGAGHNPFELSGSAGRLAGFLKSIAQGDDS